MKNRKIKIMLMLVIVCFAAAIQAQDDSSGGYFSDWFELQATPARTLARYNPSAICETDWVSAPDEWFSLDRVPYDVCVVAGSHDPSVLWLVMSHDDEVRAHRHFVISWLSGEVEIFQLIQHYQQDKAHVVYLGPRERFSGNFGIGTLEIRDFHSFESIDFDLKPLLVPG